MYCYALDSLTLQKLDVWYCFNLSTLFSFPTQAKQGQSIPGLLMWHKTPVEVSVCMNDGMGL